MPSLNPYYVFMVLVIACGGIPKGYDEGGFSASISLPSFKNDFALNKTQWKGNATGLANATANITSFGVLGAALGSIVALLLTDRLGRLRSWRLFVLLWASGIVMQIFSSGIYGFMLFARIWGGLGAGGLTVVSPLFLSEIAPAKSRGMIVSMYMVILLSFLSLGFFINYAANKGLAATATQYRLVMGIPLIPVGLAFIGSFFISDSPRWLASKDRGEESLKVLERLRGTGANSLAVQEEFASLHEEIITKQQDTRGASTITIIKEIFANPSYRKRFLLGVVMQTVAQWSGGNGITYYIPEIFTLAGVQGTNQSLITSGAYGLTKLVFTLVFTWGMIDIIGRRRCFLTGLSMQCAAHIWIAIYMARYIDGLNTNASNAAIAAVFIYAVGWSIGLCTVQYLYGTEIFPTRIRSVCYATNMALHWFFQFAVVRVTPNMLVSLHTYGAFVFWAAICAIGIVVLGLWAPETKGIPMEKMEELFSGPWYTLWKAKVDVSSQCDTFMTEKHKAMYVTEEVERV